MSVSHLIEDATRWLAWSGIILGIVTLISFAFNWSIKFRLTGSTIFTLLLSASCWAFNQSYTPPFTAEGSKYAPIVYDNGYDLVVAQASNDFPTEAIKPTLEQIAGNLKGGGRNGAIVNVRLRKIEEAGIGISRPVIIGEVLRDIGKNLTFEFTQPKETKSLDVEEEVLDEFNESIEANFEETLNSNEILKITTEINSDY